MSIDASQKSGTITTAGQIVAFSGLNYSTLGASFSGTFSAGGVFVEVSVDDTNWQKVSIYQSITPLADDEVVVAGTYRASIAGYGQVRLRASDDFTGLLTYTINTSQAVFVTIITGDTESMTYSLPLSSTGGENPTISIKGLSALGTAFQMISMNAGATALEWTGPGASGSFTAQSGETITVVNGIITDIAA